MNGVPATSLAEPRTAGGALPTPPAASRNLAVDAYRGLVMLLMMGEVLSFSRIAESHPGNLFWRILSFNQSHVQWSGCSLHDMIQPSFSFLVGVAVTYSIASRIRNGETFPRMLAHTIWRSLLLICLGFFLRSTHHTQTNFTFEDTLTQIGMGYTFLFLLGFRSPRWQWSALGVILFGYWLAWALYPAPGPSFDWAAVGVPPNWPHNFSGFASHWNKNSNLGVAIDQWWLNLFPRESPWVFNDGGYLTSSFIPTLGTMILGLIAGRWLRAAAPSIPFKKFLVTAVSLLAASAVLHYTGICPIVKRIWTPSWVLFSGGICFLFLSAFCWLLDWKGSDGKGSDGKGRDVRAARKVAFPLIVIGRNSITAYVMAELCGGFIAQSFYIHLGHRPFQAFGASYEPLILGIAVLATYWLVLYWMYRRNLFLRI